MYLNRLTLIGFTGGDAEIKTGNNGSTFIVFSVATKRSWKNSEGTWESRTEWHRCVGFGKLAEFAAGLKKGAHVQVEGELRGREYRRLRVAELIPEAAEVFQANQITAGHALLIARLPQDQSRRALKQAYAKTGGRRISIGDSQAPIPLFSN